MLGNDCLQVRGRPNHRLEAPCGEELSLSRADAGVVDECARLCHGCLPVGTVFVGEAGGGVGGAESGGGCHCV